MQLFKISSVIAAMVIAVGVLVGGNNVHSKHSAPLASTLSVQAQAEDSTGDSYALWGYRAVLLSAHANAIATPAPAILATPAPTQDRTLAIALAPSGEPDAVIARHFAEPLRSVMKVIAFCESRFTAVVSNAGDRGWFQIAAVHFTQPWLINLVASMAGPTLSVEEGLMNPDINAAAAAHLASERPSLSDWAATVGGC